MRGTQYVHIDGDGMSGRQSLDPLITRTNRIHDFPDANYNTDCGNKKTIQRQLEAATNPCLSVFNSGTDRFASTAAYRTSTFSNAVKEPYADPGAIGPGTYRSSKRAIVVKHKQVPLSSYASTSARFEKTKTDHDQISGLLSLFSTDQPPNNVKGSVISSTPRFKSTIFPEQYVFSKQHYCQHAAPDKFYDISHSCKLSVDSAVKSSQYRCSTMQSKVHRLASVCRLHIDTSMI